MGWRATQLIGIQLIFFIRLLVLARMLDPQAFGLLAIGMVALSVMLRLSDLGMIPALVQRSDATAKQYDVAWTVGLMRAIAVAVLLVVAAPLLGPLFGEPRAVTIIQVLALRPLIESWSSIGVARLTRELRFRELALIQAPGALADTVTAIATAPVLGVWALVAGSITGALTTTVLSYRFAPHKPRLDFHFQAAVPLIRYGRWVLLTGIVALAGSSTTQLIVSREIGAAGLGLYFLAAKLAFLPLDAATSVVGAVAFPLYAAHGPDQRRSAATFRALLTGQAMILLPAYGLLIALAPGVTDLLGTRWAGTAPIVQILAVACVIGLFGEVLTPVLMGRGRSDRVLRLEVIQSAVLLAGLWPLISRFGLRGAALAWLVANATTQAACVFYARRMLPGFGIGLGRQLGAAVIAGSLCASVAAITRASWGGAGGLLASLVIGFATGVTAVWLMNRRHDLRLTELLPWSPNWAGASSASAPH
jgi:PST family polysaccharide transporter/lipopolysaccharide exporter